MKAICVIALLFISCSNNVSNSDDIIETTIHYERYWDYMGETAILSAGNVFAGVVFYNDSCCIECSKGDVLKAKLLLNYKMSSINIGTCGKSGIVNAGNYWDQTDRYDVTFTVK